MGYNSTLIVLNDALGAISRDKDFGQKVADAIAMQHGSKDDVTIYSGNGNAASVVEQHHADDTAIVAVGGNCGTRIGMVGGFSHHSPYDKMRILKSLASQMGYDLRKKRKS